MEAVPSVRFVLGELAIRFGVLCMGCGYSGMDEGIPRITSIGGLSVSRMKGGVRPKLPPNLTRCLSGSFQRIFQHLSSLAL